MEGHAIEKPPAPPEDGYSAAFCRPAPIANDSLHIACRTMHLAFDGQSYDEVYNILAGLLIKVIHSYDPGYTAKVKLVAEAIERLGHINGPDSAIVGGDLGLSFNPQRFLRWMTRNGILAAVRAEGEKHTPIVGFLRAAWPPKASLLNAKPIGLAYHIHRWFGSLLQVYITSKMKEVEAQEGMMQLDHRNAHGKTNKEAKLSQQGVPCAAGGGTLDPRSGKQFASDTELWKSELDLGKMNLRWVASTCDPLFADLARYERNILYLYFAQELSWKQIAKLCRKAVLTLKADYAGAMEKIRVKAGLKNEGFEEFVYSGSCTGLLGGGVSVARTRALR